jgi:hypothetical protein
MQSMVGLQRTATKFIDKPFVVPKQPLQRDRVSAISLAIYIALLAVSAVHFYQSPYWTMDLLSYMGNARLHETTDQVTLHERVYSELKASVPADVFGLLTGAPGFKDEHGAKHDRFTNPYHYAEFLPLFAIRPMYILTIYGMSRTGMGLVQAVRLVSAASYALLGILIIMWLTSYTRLAPLLALLIMWTPHITFLGRFTGCDGISVLLGMTALFLIFEKNWLTPGLVILFGAIWFRTDNIALAIPVLFVLFLQKRLDLWKVGVLAGLTVASVLVIDNEAGHYGIRLLYYDTFIGIPIAPAEMSVQFPLSQYVHIFVNGYKQMLISFVPLFVLLGMIGWTRKTAPLLGIAAVYAAIHYAILPDWVDRYMAVFYLITMITAASRVWPRETEFGAAQ